MHVRYVGHSCLSIEMAGQRILTNPWWQGSAYDGLWCPHCPRVEQADPERVSLVFLTDVGEDHLHVPTLRSLSRQATLLIPRQRNLTLRDFLVSLGFRNVVEMAHQRMVEVAPGIRAMLVRQGEGNVLVLQGDGRTIVHANSAVQSGREQALTRTAAVIRKRFDAIDLLFASRHHHSWIPECVTFLDGTRAIPRQWNQCAEARFLNLVRELDPRMALPLEDPRERLQQPAAVDMQMQDAAVAVPPDERRLRVQTRFEPGDCILDDQLVPASQSRRRLATLLALRAGESNASAAAAGPIDPKRFARLQNRMLRNLRERAPRLLRQRSLTCRIDLDDHADASLFVQASRTQVVVEACEATRIAPLVVRLRADVLESWLTHVAGYRSITTAGGARWRLRRDHLADAWLLVEVIGRRTLPPTWTQNLSMWLLHPRRAFDIWCQRKRRRCPVEPDIWERIDPYELLQPQPEREPLRRTG